MSSEEPASKKAKRTTEVTQKTLKDGNNTKLNTDEEETMSTRKMREKITKLSTETTSKGNTSNSMLVTIENEDDIDSDREKELLDDEEEVNVVDKNKRNIKLSGTNSVVNNDVLVLNVNKVNSSSVSNNDTANSSIENPISTMGNPFENPKFAEMMVQNVLKQLMSTMNIPRPLTEEESRNVALDKAFRTVVPTREYSESEKLVGRQNYTTWLKSVRGDLKAYNLLAFVDADQGTGLVEISPSLRSTLDAQTKQFIKRTLSQSASFTLKDDESESAFETMKQLENAHGKDKHKDMIEIDRKWGCLKYWPNYDQNRYVFEFNHLVKRFSEHGIVHPDEYLVIAFLQRMQTILKESGPLAIFYRHSIYWS